MPCGGWRIVKQMDGRQVLVLVSCREPISIAVDTFIVVLFCCCCFGCGRQAADDAMQQCVRGAGALAWLELLGTISKSTL